mmetsp:Transcript_25947/g.82348  ORF Transcript_25947/g.82348 Transcript_25947/m.82348 type:complete len:246 (+) Transcript_25947:210-947(+)
MIPLCQRGPLSLAQRHGHRLAECRADGRAIQRLIHDPAADGPRQCRERGRDLVDVLVEHQRDRPGAEVDLGRAQRRRRGVRHHRPDALRAAGQAVARDISEGAAGERDLEADAVDRVRHQRVANRDRRHRQRHASIVRARGRRGRHRLAVHGDLRLVHGRHVLVERQGEHVLAEVEAGAAEHRRAAVASGPLESAGRHGVVGVLRHVGDRGRARVQRRRCRTVVRLRDELAARRLSERHHERVHA